MDDIKTTEMTLKSGKYQHYKGQNYVVYCVATDANDNKLVFYRKDYDERNFYVRPLEMFFEIKTDEDGKEVKRFTLIEEKAPLAVLKDFIAFFSDSHNVSTRHTETGELYYIYQIEIDDESQEVRGRVFPQRMLDYSGYLSDFELYRRMGYHTCTINGKLYWKADDTPVSEDRKLAISSLVFSDLQDLINPCSIDLAIKIVGAKTTRRKTVDIHSVEVVSTAESLWTNVGKSVSSYNNQNYIKIKPSQTILTHTQAKLNIPKDCAGKIEIKSTYARLSLEITAGDFCNPGLEGYFPIEITNKGKHTIIIYENEIMAQLMLVPIHGPILEEYHMKSSYMFTEENKKYDDGDPYYFWRERSIKALRKEQNLQTIVALYNKILNKITTTTQGEERDINAEESRFRDTFLSYCQRKIRCKKIGYDKVVKNKYLSDGKKPDLYRLASDYSKREQRLQRFFRLKWVGAVAATISFIFTFVQLYLSLKPEAPMDAFRRFIVSIPLWIYVVAVLVFLTLYLASLVLLPKSFCSLASINIRQICQEISAENTGKDNII